METRLLEGKILARKIKEEIKKEVDALRAKYNLPITLTAIQVGENPSSEVYIKSQEKTATNLGINYNLLKLKDEIREERLLDLIQEVNSDSKINGIIIQMPLPAEFNRTKIISSISILKDVEGLHPANLGELILGRAGFIPCTAQAVMQLVKSTGLNLYGKEVVIIGHSEIVGKPLTMLFLNEFSTVTVCHIGTSDAGHLQEHVRRAEVLIVAVGKAHLVKGDWIREGAVVVDVGINRVGDKIVGDVEFEVAAKRAAFISPVPGGVGPLTVTMLMKNVVQAFKIQHS